MNEPPEMAHTRPRPSRDPAVADSRLDRCRITPGRGQGQRELRGPRSCGGRVDLAQPVPARLVPPATLAVSAVCDRQHGFGDEFVPGRLNNAPTTPAPPRARARGREARHRGHADGQRVSEPAPVRPVHGKLAGRPGPHGLEQPAARGHRRHPGAALVSSRCALALGRADARPRRRPAEHGPLRRGRPSADHYHDPRAAAGPSRRSGRGGAGLAAPPPLNGCGASGRARGFHARPPALDSRA